MALPGDSADLREGRPGFGDLHAVDDRRGAIARHQVKGVATVGRNVDEAIPRGRIAGEALWIGLEVG